MMVSRSSTVPDPLGERTITLTHEELRERATEAVALGPEYAADVTGADVLALLDSAARSVRMHVAATERHMQTIHDVTQIIADGGSSLDILRKLIWWLDGVGALGADEDEDALLRRAWDAAGGTDDDWPVITLVIPAEEPTDDD